MNGRTVIDTEVLISRVVLTVMMIGVVLMAIGSTHEIETVLTVMVIRLTKTGIQLVVGLVNG
jgi:hypothetical protein